MLETTGVEPVTSCVQNMRSTIELGPHYELHGSCRMPILSSPLKIKITISWRISYYTLFLTTDVRP